MSEEQTKEVYRVVMERNSRAGTEDEILSNFFNDYEITGAKVKKDFNGVFVTGLTEAQAKKLANREGVNTCRKDEPTLANQPGWESN